MAIFKQIHSGFKDLIYCMYPLLCIACIREPRIQEGLFCVHCLAGMPYTDHFVIKENKVTQHFWGRVPLKFGAALLYFRANGIVQNMMHSLKYQKKAELGIVLGEIAGQKLMDCPHFERPDLLIPIPLHPSKEIARGYNQSYIFGQGVAKKLEVPLSKEIILKTTKTTSQTGKSRTDRVENVSKTFKLVQPEKIVDKNILILDDVVTTGATIEALALKLIEGNAKSLSVLVIAAAE